MITIEKTTKIKGRIVINTTLVKEMTAEVDKDGVSTFYETVYDADLIKQNRAEVRKNEREFTKVKEDLEDAVVLENEKDDTH